MIESLFCVAMSFVLLVILLMPTNRGVERLVILIKAWRGR